MGFGPELCWSTILGCIPFLSSRGSEMRLPFDIGFCYHPDASDEDNAEILRLALEFLIA